MAVGAGAAASEGGATAVVAGDGQTRSAVVALLVERGPVTAAEISDHLQISGPGVRRHLDAMLAAGEVVAVTTSARHSQRGRGRPARRFQLTAAGRAKLRHAYDDLAGAAMRRLRDLGGEQAVRDFAADRIEAIVAGVEPVPRGAGDDVLVATAEQIADSLTTAGFSANTRRVGAGVQICQHHCPVAHVAADFPELCEAETARFTELLGTHVQRLATIANGDCACTTHVPLSAPTGRRSDHDSPSGTDAQLASASATTREDSR
nr:transcriptional regulator [Williamsia sp. CHRR-6]